MFIYIRTLLYHHKIDGYSRFMNEEFKGIKQYICKLKTSVDTSFSTPYDSSPRFPIMMSLERSTTSLGPNYKKSLTWRMFWLNKNIQEPQVCAHMCKACVCILRPSALTCKVTECPVRKVLMVKSV